MSAVRDGELDELTPLFERHARRLFGFLRGLVGSRAAAEDLVQETFLRILRHRASYRAGRAFLPWLLGIARNAAWAHLKKQARMPPGEAPEPIDAASQERRQLERERAELLTRALGRLPENDREGVQLSEPGRPAHLQAEVEWGSIRVVGDAGARELTIDLRGDRPDESTGGLVRVSESGNAVAITQVPSPKGGFRSANLEIRVPLETSLDLRMNRGGDIRVQRVRGLVEVTNLNGSVDIADLAGAAAVNASNGAISASFTEVDPGRDMLFASLNGSVELCLPSAYSGRPHLTTAGDPIRSDFPVEPDAPGRVLAPGETLTLDSSEVRGRIGSGEARLRVSTLNGEIHLRRCD